MLGLGLTKFAPEAVYVTCIAVFFLTIFYRPQVGLYFVTFLIPLQNVRDKLIPFTFGQNMMDFLILGIVISLFLHSKKNKNPLPIDRSMVYPSLLLIVGTYSALWVGYFKLGQKMPISFDSEQLILWKNFIELPFLYFITLATVRDRKQVFILIAIMTCTVLLMDFYFYDNARWLDFSHYADDLRDKSGNTFNYLGPNETAGFLAEFTLFLIGLLIMQKKKLWKFLLAGIIAFNFYCVLYYFSRGAYVAVLGGLLFLGLVKEWKIILILVVLLIGWRMVLPGSVVERIEMTESDKGLDASSESRIDMWSTALGTIKSNPFTGIGFGNTRYLGIASGRGNVRNSLHDGYLSVLVEQGVMGLAIILYIFWSGIKRGWRLFKRTDDRDIEGLGLGFAAMITASLIGNLFGTHWFYFDVMGYFWIIFALVMRSSEMSAYEHAARLEASPAGRLSESRV
jgi:O-antigen ligase